MIASQDELLIPGIGFIAICGLAALEPSLWFRWMGENGLGLLLQEELPPDVTRLHLIIFALCELLLVGGYLWLLTMTWLAMKRMGAETRGLHTPSSTPGTVAL